jgi:hypothetical protein
MKLFLYTLIVFLFGTYTLIAQPPCNEEIAEPTGTCSEAPMICELDLYCGTMPGINNSGGPVCNGGFYLHNTHWFSFVATSTTVTVTIEPTNCITVGGGRGLQGAILDYCPQSFPYPTIGHCQGACTEGQFTIGTGGFFVIGKQYWILLDGCSGSICDYQIVATQGITIPVLDDPTGITGPTTICPGGTAKFTVDDPIFATTFHWIVDGIVVTSLGHELEYTFPSGTPEGTYEICLEDAENECFGLVADNGYIAGSICYEFEVKGLQPTNIGPIDVCVEKAPYIRDGRSFVPPVTNQQYTLKSPAGCDSTINLTINWIQHNPSNQTIALCPNEFPYIDPIHGEFDSAGIYDIQYQDQLNMCDSSYTLTIQAVNFDFASVQDQYNFYCDGSTLSINATDTKAKFMPEGIDIGDTWFEWYQNGVLISTDSEYEFTMTGAYTLRMYADHEGFICSEDFNFQIGPPLLPTPAILIGSGQACVGNEITLLLDLQGNSFSNVSFPNHACFVSEITPEYVKLTLLDTCLVDFCIITEKENCTAYRIESCMDISVLPKFDFSIEGRPSICERDSAYLIVDPNFISITWIGPDGFTSNHPNIFTLSEGNYFITATDSRGCTANDSIVVVKRPLPPITYTGSTTFCSGGQVRIDIIEQEYLTYQWSDLQTGNYAIFDQEGPYSLRVIDSFLCNNVLDIYIQESDSLTPSVVGTTNFCPGAYAEFYAGPSYETYKWNGINGESSHRMYQSGELILHVQDPMGCAGSKTFYVNASDSPILEQVQILNDTGESDGAILVRFDRFKAGNYTYEWSNGANTPKITNLEAGEYTVTVTHPNGCRVVYTFEVQLNENFNFRNNEIERFIFNSEPAWTNLNIYPNPFSDVLIISRPTLVGEATISLLDLNGKICFKQEIGMQESISLNLENIPPGPYILLYTSAEENYRRLVIKE